MKKSIDYFTKSSRATLQQNSLKKSKKFSALAEATNISVVFENKRKFKKSFVKTKVM